MKFTTGESKKAEAKAAHFRGVHHTPDVDPRSEAALECIGFARQDSQKIQWSFHKSHHITSFFLAQ
jgi:hypothetical protein